MIRSSTAGRFLPSRAGEIFLLVRSPPQPRGAVLVVPPFAEEMNKCRRMVTDVALELCALGCAVLVPDLYGTGDSQGTFADARWGHWEADLEATCAWGEANGLGVRALLAIRLGAALAISAVRNGRLPDVAVTALWQPVLDGAQYLTQFLRLRTAGNLGTKSEKESVADLRSKLAAGQNLEIAGYNLSASLAADLSAVEPRADIPSQLGAIHWMEVVRTPESEIPIAARTSIERLRGSSRRIAEHTFIGEPFWGTVEISEIPNMIHRTARSLVDGLPR